MRLDRLLVDYMLRHGYSKSAEVLARERNIEALVDREVFLQCHAIEQSLKRRETADCLKWCSDNRQALKKMNVSLGANRLKCPRLCLTNLIRIHWSSSFEDSNLLS